MKRIFATLMTLLLIFSMTSAFAIDEKIGITIQPVDYQTGQAVNKSYVENELFRLRVDVDVPRFMDLTDLEMVVECDGVEIEQPSLQLVTGRYYIEGIVVTNPSAICIKINDMAFANAETAEDLYLAMKEDRAVTACYNFTAPKVEYEMSIPKTGDYTVTGIVMLGLILLAAVVLYQTAKRAKR